CTSDSRQIFSTSATPSGGRVLSRYSATVFGSMPTPGPDRVGAVNLRRRMTSRMRLTSDEAKLLSLSLSPISFVWEGSRMSSRYASKVRKVSRMVSSDVLSAPSRIRCAAAGDFVQVFDKFARFYHGHLAQAPKRGRS